MKSKIGKILKAGLQYAVTGAIVIGVLSIFVGISLLADKYPNSFGAGVAITLVLVLIYMFKKVFFG